MGFFRTNSWPDPFQSFGDAVDVRINRKQGLPKREKQHTTCGLRADTIKPHQIIICLLRIHLMQKLQINPSAVSADLSQNDLNSRGLDIAQTADADAALHFLYRR